MQLTLLQLTILRRLKTTAERSLPFIALCPDRTQIRQSAVKDALRDLRHNGLVALRRDGRWEITRDGQLASQNDPR